MKKKIFNNLLLKILSVVAAALLWLVVVNIDDAVTYKDFKGIKVNVINTDILTEKGQMCRIDEGTDTVDITVWARRTAINKLKPSDFTATADMKKNLRLDSMVSIDVACTASNVSIDRIEQSRANVLVSIEKSVTEQFKVNVNTSGKPSEGLARGSVIPEQTLIEVTGPESVVERIKKVETSEVSIVGITGTATRRCRLRLLDSDGNEIDGTYLDYVGKEEDSFEVTITTLNTKLAGISFDISTAAPEGYGLNAISYTPETVTIAGLKSDISPIYNVNIPASALNPDGQTGQFVQTVDISQYLPDGIIMPYEEEHEIVVTMDIVPYETASYTFLSGQIQYLNIPEGLELDVAGLTPLEVRIGALASDLAALTIENITVSVDLSECRRAGTYTVPVTVTIPDKYRVQEGLELSVTLTASEQEE